MGQGNYAEDLEKGWTDRRGGCRGDGNESGGIRVDLITTVTGLRRNGVVRTEKERR